MTSLQIKVAVMVNDLGSISSAANALEISQPNVSNYLKTLENEIGFPIFIRSKNGVSITTKGLTFIEHAKKILSEQNSIMEIKKADDIYRLRLGSVSYNAAVVPFINLCNKYREDYETDFRFYSVTIEEGINKLENYELDVVFAPILKSQIAGMKDACKRKNLSTFTLCNLPATINVRKDHPAIKDGKIKNITQGCDIMKDYPYITFRNLSEDSSSTSYNDSSYIECSYKMYVDEMDIRLRLISATNGFSLGIIPSAGICEKYNIVAFPIPGITLDLLCITRNGDLEKKEIKEYISLLKDEINKVSF